MTALLEIKDLSCHFRTPKGLMRAVDGINLEVASNETLAIVGESGCGKSVTSMSILGLVGGKSAELSGSITLEGTELLGLPERKMRKVRGKRISMIFQEPMTSLNPVMTVGRQIEETLRLHTDLDRQKRADRVVEMLELVGIPDPKRRLKEYPHQLSGGMRQRIMIAMALACEPQLLIADEPTTALDVTIQAQILDVMREMKSRLGSAIILITHDLGVVAGMADRVAVMYAGKTVETAPVSDLFKRPVHPYTRGLLRALPTLGASLDSDERQRLADIPGQVPAMGAPPVGCSYAARCPISKPRCSSETPKLSLEGPKHSVACHFPQEAINV